MSILTSLKSAARFAYETMRSEKGSALEAVIILPALATIYAGSFVFFDAARTNTLAMKATYTVSDILSREDEVDEPFLDGLNTMMTFLVPSNATPKTRVTLITYNDDAPQANKYRVGWSYASQGSNLGKLTQADLDTDSAWIPIMGDDETVVVTESYVLYQPLFNVGWEGPTVFKNIMVTRPRFASTLTKIDEPEGPVGDDDIDDEGNENAV
jgi:hypothetical protein